MIYSGSKNRGIQSIHANTDAKAVLTELIDAFDEFKANDLAERATLKAQVEQLETIVARGEFGGGGDGISGGLETASAREHEKVFLSSFVRKGVVDGLADLGVKASLTTSSDPDGGYTVPTRLDNTIEQLVDDSVSMRRVATVKQIETPDYKKLVSVGGASSGWVSEQEARPETTTPVLKLISPPSGEIYANPSATQTTLDDASQDIGAWLVEEIASEFADKEGSAFINGNGVGRPKGILDYSMSTDVDADRDWGKLQYVAGGAATVLSDPDKLIDLVHSLRAKYRKGAVWMMNSSTIAIIRKLKDGDGNYIWRDGLEKGAPNSLLGYLVEEDENMPDIAAGAFPIAFANFKRGYLIVDRTGIRLLRDPWTNKPYVHFYTTKRVGGCCQNYEAIKLLKVAA